MQIVYGQLLKHAATRVDWNPHVCLNWFPQVKSTTDLVFYLKYLLFQASEQLLCILYLK